MAEKSQTKAAAAMADDKKRAIETAMQQIERTYGKGSIMRFGDNTVSNVEAISTGSLALDLALGIGGLPKGRIIEIYGPESSGKTTLALHVLAQAQKAGGEVAFIDAEHALDITYARALGVKVEDMLVSQPDTGEQALEITEALVRSGAIDVIVVDSVAALVPRAEIEGEMGDGFGSWPCRRRGRPQNLWPGCRPRRRMLVAGRRAPSWRGCRGRARVWARRFRQLCRPPEPE